MTMINAGDNVDPLEVRKFDKLASRWWDPEGEFKPLHRLNPVRIGYVAERAVIAGSRCLDIGCGGGLLTEGLAQLGADVTGIDMAGGPLTVARMHQEISGLEGIRYLESSAEQLALDEAGLYDTVTCMEVLEHVPDPASLVAACRQLVKPGGNIFLSTINRNPKSFLMAIVGAEYVLGMLPRSTHEYARFIKPSELRRWSLQAGLHFRHLCGMTYSPFSGDFALSDDVDVNYLMHLSAPE
ncbi:MAG: bifunctional 2-polyprenyl-6-hydroxyphenol methylase/3-demethylubiquinol 3-O-methyltransferase UbiG [Gammaproteobacteria bacterium]|jgi:2-polyprenyl-6-hydroxyphenyl methylase/3-demethylubiquinone-9 3-methyltransferase|nr:bifunctional 2-polyprenyl-6-hydroxyphenol methylase/3-demethylubiquinol 3-O-methyltransferase UbiG [Gammaproteobacteria bacterium]MDP7094486.1 bifunctional 2-polyprenyl-6-hydroxyphenol methylase/3-demethylubiquinol 3-O-methyltransferase UbiG [Gammaproteobacteria bacterium]MDP7270219.1 bifunctional 2-polyprenyl-6-hydroxyphenol methylase/3-demethylubiquinol 3-O-methyltransferase UbiG [Gammaproteobacteria bacterium]HJP05078.1 bifunctional 2-polyprenyl-6-hydroxyphenol methylase/3-demethylubiquino